MRYTKELRWKVCKRVHVSDLQARLNKLSKGDTGWNVREIIRHSYYLYSIIATRVVTTPDPKGKWSHR